MLQSIEKGSVGWKEYREIRAETYLGTQYEANHGESNQQAEPDGITSWLMLTEAIDTR
jgi:hypothetical protein